MILANPPFMSPKGGIRPHNRFSVKSKRSEVLFVDYMAEHLTPNGRAGIIVPEGVIFQSQNAYKQLRKMLVENYLVAVVSLPAGVFQPYSGVKTSILILDKSLAKKTDRIAFFKVENDGFDLGAQRRAIDKNDLPQVARELRNWNDELRIEGDNALIVEKAKIAADGEYNLSGERYREGETRTKTKWPMVALKDICGQILSGGTPSTKVEKYWKGNIPWITSANIVNIKTANPRKYITEEAIRESATNFIPKGNVIVVTRVGLGKLLRNDFDVCISQDSQGLIVKDGVNADYLVYILKDRVENFKKVSQGSTIQGVTKKQLAEIQIPLPPLEVQQEIVAEIEAYQKVIDGARAVIDNYRPHIPIDPEWPPVKIRDVSFVKSGFGFPTSYQGKVDEQIPFLKVSDMNLPENETRILSWNNTVAIDTLQELKARSFPSGTVIFPKIGAAIATNKKRILTCESTYDNNVMGIVPDTNKLLTGFLYTYLIGFDLSQWASNGQPPSMRKTVVEEHELPLPPLSVQQKIVDEIETEQALVAANRELIERMEKKIQAAIGRVWGEG